MVRKKGRKRRGFYCCSKMLQYSYFSLSEPGNYWYYYNTSTGTTQWEHPVDTVIRKKLSHAREYSVDTVIRKNLSQAGEHPVDKQQLEQDSEQLVVKQKQIIEKDHPVDTVIQNRVVSTYEHPVVINQKYDQSNSMTGTSLKREQENEERSKYLVNSIQSVRVPLYMC